MLFLFKINLITEALFMKMKTTFIIFLIISNVLFTPHIFANENPLNLVDQEKTKTSLKLGWMYFNGEGVHQDYKKAFMSFNNAAEKGDAKATWEVAKMYLAGVGVTKDAKKGKAWLEKAFIRLEQAGLQGDGHASRKVAEMYQWGGLKKRDIKKAVIWYEKAGEQGDARALLTLGSLYVYGLGLTWDTDRGYKLFQKAADLGNTKALSLMGSRYYHGRFLYRGYREGRDMIQDYKKAYMWHKKAAEQGHAYAHENLAAMYEKGLGVTKNYRTALKYYYLSKHLGNKSTDFLQELKRMESLMTDTEIDRAKQLAEGWLKAHKKIQILKSRCENLLAILKDANHNAATTHLEFGRDLGCGWS